MDKDLEKLVREIDDLINKYKVINSGEMARIGENTDEVVIYLKPKFKGKNIVIIYHDYIS